MVSLLKENIASIKQMCETHHIKLLYLIGSAAGTEQDFTDDSDVDFIYTFDKDSIGEMEYADNYFSFLFSLQQLLNRKVDLVPEEKINNPYFRNQINKTKQMIYAS